MKLILSIVFSALLVGCATPVSHTNIPLSTYDKDTEYGIEDREDGFEVTVYYSRYQFIPESDAYNKPLNLVPATKSVTFTRTRLARPLAERYVPAEF